MVPSPYPGSTIYFATADGKAGLAREPLAAPCIEATGRCDKTVPSQLMAVASPGLQVTGRLENLRDRIRVAILRRR